MIVMIEYPIKSSLFTCFVNKFQPVKLLEQKGVCYIPCIELHQYFIDLEFTNYVLVWYLIIDLINLQISMEVSAGLKCKPSGNRGENSAATNYLSLDEYPFTCKLCFFTEYQNTMLTMHRKWYLE